MYKPYSYFLHIALEKGLVIPKRPKIFVPNPNSRYTDPSADVSSTTGTGIGSSDSSGMSSAERNYKGNYENRVVNNKKGFSKVDKDTK